ncbi:sulfotransferase domain-containing protein [Nonlabens dokdonensis]|uniref:sulfotransferase domain-containing protein n=1 Tax=Nonlabens dokdonensis TaxID=328515 RepID=UPI0002FF2636|nr:sulfotransferase domain-containing protein [Nonlabens dokdonensis]
MYLKGFYQKKLLHLSTGKRAKHIVLKIVNAHGLIDDLATLIPSKTVALMRHPFSQSLSVMRNKWGTCESAFIESSNWSELYLSQDQLQFAKKVSNTGSYFEKAVLNWCLEWHFPLHYSNTEILRLYYEDLVLNGTTTITRLYNYLGFKEIQNGVDVLNQPSKSSNFSTKATIEGIKNNNKNTMISSWRSQLAEVDLVNGQKILDAFNVTVYSRFSDTPQL